nr:immunoglobulin heavy chain junction region [Macaca mulatta]MOW77944.1 immunoglobulin heavy chain junction region [Macaca mulatta]MOW80662.1 immunoglobulin heavy chain junction region [Macaca mulatta]MOW82407.1 immunoglobulin heavy chain junction region [Macaca mulatta]MOW83237.1 immunoglobulin heavy chain junction region [Macaca mulatta]
CARDPSIVVVFTAMPGYW